LKARTATVSVPAKPPACKLKFERSEALTVTALAAEFANEWEPLTRKLSLAAPPVPMS
jgi:hypothetical protein